MATIVEKSKTHIPLNWTRTAQIALLITGWFLIGWFARGLFSSASSSDLALIQKVQEAIATKYYGDVPPSRELAYAAIRGMIGSIGDPYAVFNEPPQAAHATGALQGSSAVIGIRGEMSDGEFVITYVTPEGPAELAGLQAGDVVLEVDGWRVRADAEYMEVMTMIRGPQESTARLLVERSDQSLTFEIPRQAVPETTAEILDGGIAFLRFDQVTEKTPEAVRQALDELLAQQPSGLIVDLRNNGGGLMKETQDVLDLFLPEGVAFYARMKDSRLIPYPTTSGGPAENIPLVVLVGPHTYSAPETLAASIADRERGVLIGETTFGKGAIRETIYLNDGSSLQITVAQWLSPVHQESFEGRGVPPDIIAAQNPDAEQDAALEAAVEYLSK